MSFFTPITNAELDKIIAYTDDIMQKETPHSSPVKSQKKSIPKIKGEIEKQNIKLDDVDDIIRAVNKERGVNFAPTDIIPEVKVIKDSSDLQMEKAIAKILPHAVVNGNDINDMTDIKSIIRLIKSRSYTDAEVPLILDKIKRLGASNSTIQMVKRFINSQSSTELIPLPSTPSTISPQISEIEIGGPADIQEEFSFSDKNLRERVVKTIKANANKLTKDDMKKRYFDLTGQDTSVTFWKKDKDKLVKIFKEQVDACNDDAVLSDILTFLVRKKKVKMPLKMSTPSRVEGEGYKRRSKSKRKHR